MSMREDVFKGAYCYFIRRIERDEQVVVGTCNADDHWEALEKFQNAGCISEPLQRGKLYKITRDAGMDGHLFCMRFVY